VHTFNRIFVLVMLSLLLVLGAFVLIAPAAWLSLMRSIADWFRGTVFVAYSDTGRVLARVLMAVVWAALIGSLIWLELRQGSSRDIEIVHHAGESTIRISTEDVRERVKSQVDAIPGVLGSKVHVIGRDRAVELKLDVTVTKDLDLVAKAEEVALVARQVAQDQLGLRLAGKPQVSIRAKAGSSPIAPAPARPAATPVVEPTPSPAPSFADQPVVSTEQPTAGDERPA
jgi:hypothetical protein